MDGEMPEPMHERYDRDERALVLAAADELWTDPLLDAVIDVAAPILDAASWRGVPKDVAELWAERATAANALAAMALRATRAVALTVRAGYAAEALSGIRRLFEVAGHAQRVAEDASGQYAANWLRGEGRAGKPRVAFGADAADKPSWDLMSGQSHAEFAAYAGLSASLDDDRIMRHFVGPQRDPFWDSIWIWMTARQLVRVLACVLKVHPSIDQRQFLTTATELQAAEARIEAEVAKRRG